MSDDKTPNDPAQNDPTRNNETGSGARVERQDFKRSATSVKRQREVIEAAIVTARKAPGQKELARRQATLKWAKWLLPSLALLLLASIAIWPEIDRLMNANRAALTEVTRLKIESGNLEGAVYRSVDVHGRPYMITAKTAHQINEDRIDLINPAADTLSQGGEWLYLQAEKGVYMQHEQILDLKDEVTLYRDDGLMMRGPVADVSMHDGVIASDSWVHAEGPFGVLDARGYWLSQHEGIAQFRGPGRFILNDDRNGPHDKAS
ncbi:LPS export ABC transporter periplasmic protein LptC [Acetobacter sicerae]|uniref:LPS export ABC transporter periplasmic protein LptC n=1 Tax=Acetobacter sicerae TaxID=85325 RepID=A0ABS8VV46_9PROT|nr:LPS export ABC transporter periplasmic protein LptC [Acetobacter sicerae]MCE0744555.1 LPS export ABC transporter periplasmic protein LptC [Acetobacter sicerae]NHN92302.1 LPS export ABC transporter periplasmic protein LptC [Acetobacter sicerae]